MAKLNPVIALNLLIFIVIGTITLNERISRVAYLILFVWGVCHWVRQRKSIRLSSFEKSFLWVGIAYLLSGMVSFWIHMPYKPGAILVYETYAYVICFVPITLLLKRYSLNMKTFLWAVALMLICSGIGAGYIRLFVPKAQNLMDHNPNEFVTPMVISTLMMIGYYIHWRKFYFTLPIVGGLAAIYFSESRAGWGIFLLLFLYLVFTSSKSVLFKTVSIVVLLIALLGVSQTRLAKQRYRDTIADLTDYPNKNKDTSIGHRLEMQKIGFYYFKENPWIGIGPGRLADHDYTRPFMETERYLPKAFDHRHFHNQYVEALATRGVPGLLTLLALYLVPFIYFWRRQNSPRENVRFNAKYGVITVASFVMVSFTNAPLEFKVLTIFFTTMIAVFHVYQAREAV